MGKIDSRLESYQSSMLLGEPISDYVEIDDGCKRDFEGGTIYATYPGSYSRLVCGPIQDLYLSLGETSSDLGVPLSTLPHEISALDIADVGYDYEALEHRFQFGAGWVYWHPDHEAPHIVRNLVHDFYLDEGGWGELGFPLNDTSVDSHEGEVLFQAFDEALIFENVDGELEIFRDEMLDAYLDGASDSGGPDPIDDPLDAEMELGVPTAGYLPTPNGLVRLLHSGTIYYRDGDVLDVFPDSVLMLDGRVVVPGANPDTPAMRIAIEEDPYLADFRKDVVLEALSHEGLCGDAARRSVGTSSTEYCSEFVREIYTDAGVDRFLWGGGIYLWSVTYAAQLRWIFEHNSRFVRAHDADLLTAEPGDYLSVNDEGHSALVVATSVDGAHLFRVGGNEGPDDCVDYWRDIYFDGSGAINSSFYGFGKLDASFF